MIIILELVQYSRKYSRFYAYSSFKSMNHAVDKLTTITIKVNTAFSNNADWIIPFFNSKRTDKNCPYVHKISSRKCGCSASVESTSDWDDILAASELQNLNKVIRLVGICRMARCCTPCIYRLFRTGWKTSRWLPAELNHRTINLWPNLRVTATWHFKIHSA